MAITRWFRRKPAVPQDQFSAERKYGWQLQLSQAAETAFMTALRAYHNTVNPLVLHGEHSVVTVARPPRAISMYVLADRFAALSHNALRDPEAAVEGLMRVCVDVEQPGVLHLRENWLTGEAHGLDRAGLVAAMRDITGEIDGWYGDAELGWVAVVVDDNTMMIDLAGVLDAWAQQPGAPLSEVVERLVAAGGLGVTWTRPPVSEQQETVLAAARGADGEG